MNQPDPAAPMDDLRARSVVIDALSSSLDRGKNGLASVPGLLRQVLEDSKWRHFVTLRGEEVHHDDFLTFITAPPLRGLGATEDLVRRLAADDIATLALLDTALQKPAGRPAAPPSQQDENVYIVHSSPRPAGNSRQRALRQLKEQRPDLLARVESGDIPSLHAAMVEAGLRGKTLSVPVGDPEKIARSLRKNLTEDDLQTLISLLSSSQARPGS
ncbi:hypothetical protein OJ963_40460 [Streptomyces sp. RS2]|uniref:hypothetical protein n=1 Tax=unclassified Streptomyces TaxID=2593676 RepID=UPI001C27587A|nr:MULTISPECIES: hypothetical protein [unclassified Streptomyces]MCW1100066.1 hypothetical protein [Streptomyces sp. RS2]